MSKRIVLSSRSSERSSSTLPIPVPPSPLTKDKHYRSVGIRRELKNERELLNATFPSSKVQWRDARTNKSSSLHSVTWQDARGDVDNSARLMLNDTFSDKDSTFRSVAGYDISTDKDTSVRSEKTSRNYRSLHVPDIAHSINDKDSAQANLDTNRTIPIVQWQKISSVPETERADDSINISNAIDLKKCLTCKEDRKILKLLPCLHSFCQQCLGRQIQENPRLANFRWLYY